MLPFSTFNDPGNNQNNPCYGAAQQKQPFHIAVNCAGLPDKRSEDGQRHTVSNPHIYKGVCKKLKDTDTHQAYSRLEQPA